MKLYYPITVDLYKPYPLPLVEAQQNNIGRGVLVTLTAQGAVITPTGESIQLYAKKPDGTISYLPCTISGSQIQCDFTNQMLALPGIVQVELQMIGGTSGNETEITTPIFCVKVNPSNVDDSAVESQDEFPALVTALAEVAELKANGLKGDPGEAATIQVGTVTASDPGSNPQVTNTGTEQNAILNFVLPRGQQGPQGIPGEGVTFGAYSSFPNPGQTNVLYVDTATTDALSIWRWNGTEYVTVDTSDIAVIADPYNPDNTYAARAYCTNEGGFYKSKQAIDVAEAWTPSHWTKTTVAAELSALNSSTSLQLSEYIVLIHSGNVVHIDIYIASTTYSVGWNTIGTIPEELRPGLDVQVVAMDNGASSREDSFPIQLRITTSGDINAYIWPSHLTAQIYGNVTYIIP